MNVDSTRTSSGKGLPGEQRRHRTREMNVGGDVETEPVHVSVSVRRERVYIEAISVPSVRHSQAPPQLGGLGSEW